MGASTNGGLWIPYRDFQAVDQRGRLQAIGVVVTDELGDRCQVTLPSDWTSEEIPQADPLCRETIIKDGTGKPRIRCVSIEADENGYDPEDYDQYYLVFLDQR